MKLSVVISTYNGEKYIEEQLESLYKQSRIADEVLIFDDCSTDKTFDVITEFINANHLINWNAQKNINNKGWKRNFIEGLWSATGDVVLSCDQDDIWMPDKLEAIERLFEKIPDMLLLTTNCIAFYPDGRELIRPKREDTSINIEKPHYDFFEVKYPGCTYAVRKELIDKSKEYWECDFPHDALLWRMALYLDGAYSYNRSLIKWRKHAESAYTIESIKSKTFDSKREWLNYAIRALNSVIRLIKENKVDEYDYKMAILNRNVEAIQARISFYDYPSIKKAIKLVKYKNEYSRFRQILGDWYLVLKRKRCSK